MATVRELFATNTFGTMAMTQAVLPQFRARRAGVVVNAGANSGGKAENPASPRPARWCRFWSLPIVVIIHPVSQEQHHDQFHPHLPLVP